MVVATAPRLLDAEAPSPLAALVARATLWWRGELRVGHLVGVDGVTGTVERLGWLHARLRRQDGSLVDLPTQRLAFGRVENFSLAPVGRVRLDLNAPEGLTEDAVRCAAVTALVRSPLALKAPAPDLQPCDACPAGQRVWHFVFWARDEDRDAARAQLGENVARELARRGGAAPPPTP